MHERRQVHALSGTNGLKDALQGGGDESVVGGADCRVPFLQRNLPCQDTCNLMLRTQARQWQLDVQELLRARTPTPRVAACSNDQNQGVLISASMYAGQASSGTHRKVRYSGDTNMPAKDGGQTANAPSHPLTWLITMASA